jgi:putative nucleotidyltransferase with HDIG domain
MTDVKGMQREAGSLKRWFAEMLARLRSQLTLKDLLIGVGAALAIATMVRGFQLQTLPEYQVGEIAGGDVRAFQDLSYEDIQATAGLRKAAQERTPAIYVLDVERISDQEMRITQAFAAARRILSEQQVAPQGKLARNQQARILLLLGKELENIIPPESLQILLDQRFDSALEAKIQKILDNPLRSGIVADGEAFRQHLKRGILVRDKTSAFEKPLGDSSRVRTLDAAKEYLRQLHLELAELPAPARAKILGWLDAFLIPTLIYDAKENENRQAAAAARVQPSEIEVKKGKVLVRSGEEVTARAVEEIGALRKLQKPRPIAGQILGLSILVAGLLYAIWRYFVFHQKHYRKIRTYGMLVITVLLLVATATRLLTGLVDIVRAGMAGHFLQNSADLYAVLPFACAALLATLLVDLNVGLVVSMTIAVLVGLIYGNTYYSVYALLGSLAACFSVKQYRERAVIFRSGLAVGSVNALTLTGMHFVRQEPVLSADSLILLALAMISGILASALSATVLPFLESGFKITTDIRLLELSNLNSPALRRLSFEAPGTYHHSLMVGNLAEAAAQAIGANPLLAQVGAYYHDLGKMLKPEYFTENQRSSENKHDELTPAMSCSIIAGHIQGGLELAKAAGIPEAVRDMIPQHHGTRIMKYFYEKAKGRKNPEDPEIQEADFRYPGPKPQSKEAAILMMADSVEAASRTLSDPSPDQIQGLIDRLVGDVVADNQLDECNITIREIQTIKESFFKVIGGVHHHRIDYPGYNFKLPQGQADGTPPPDLTREASKGKVSKTR